MGIIKKNATKKSCKSNEAKIALLKNELALCKRKIKKLYSTSTDNFSRIAILKLDRELEVEVLRKDVLVKKLATLGITESRGRPKKNDTEKYSYNRCKFTAMLLPDNLSYLQELKDTKKIDNISSFLDLLIENYRVLHQ